MTARFVSVGDDLTLPPPVKVPAARIPDLTEALSATYGPLDLARLGRAATRGYVDSTTPRMAERYVNIASGATGSVTFAGLPVVGNYTFASPMRVILSLRDNTSTAKNFGEWTIGIGREEGAAAVQVGAVTNLKGTDFSTSAGTIVAATCSTDGSRVTISITNGRANLCAFRIQLRYFTPARRLESIFCWGDSLTAGAAQSYPGYLATASAVPAVNLGIGGEQSSHIAARAQAIMTTLTSAATVPTSGGVNISTNTGIATAGQTLPIAAALGNVPGTITRSGSNTVFTRNAAGHSVTFPAGTPVIFTDSDAAKEATQVVWAGSNDAETMYAATLANVVAIANASRSGRTIVLGVHLSADYPTGTATHTAAEAVNAALAAAFGAQFIDIRRWLITSGLAAAGITATAQDTTDIANDIVPSSLRSDTIHLTSAAYQLVANQVWAKIQALGYDSIG